MHAITIIKFLNVRYIFIFHISVIRKLNSGMVSTLTWEFQPSFEAGTISCVHVQSKYEDVEISCSAFYCNKFMLFSALLFLF